MNPGYVYSFKRVAFMFGDIMVNAHCQRSFIIVILIRHLACWVGAAGRTSRSLLVHIDGTLNSVRYISGVLRPVALPFTRALRNLTFQQDNARSHVASIVRTFLDR
ncbi:hypothetical protein TNCV_4942401 [Trichonephila clavipes]|nr:hypothetical protein TNCV_4942401 [Trichonephila clavipes]